MICASLSSFSSSRFRLQTTLRQLAFAAAYIIVRRWRSEVESEEPEQLVGTPYYTRAPAPVTGLTRVAAEHLVVFAQLMSFPFGIDLPFCVTEDRLREPLAPTFKATQRDHSCLPSRFSH